MKFLKYSALLFTALLILSSCSGANYKFKLDTTQRTTLGKKATISFKQIEGEKIDSFQLYVNGKRLIANNYSTTLNTSDLGIGKHAVTAMAFYPGKVKKLNNFIEVFASKAPTFYSYKIVNTYPHDTDAFTQGLEFYNGYLYETTGRRGKSWLRKVDYKTGKVLQQKNLDKKYFGEGMTIFNNKIFWLTWQEGKGFIYSLDDFEQIGEFKYDRSLQGWGLTHNEIELVKSDGTNKIWFLDPTNLKELRYIEAYTHKSPVKDLNELEWVEGKIYANYWRKPSIAIINPKNGIVEGVVDLKGLVKEMQKTQRLDGQDEVLNGIAYDAEEKRLFVTGKNWAKMFEIELVKK